MAPAAYFISAHGGEGLAEFRVPAGCTIVIKANPGSYIIREKAAKLMRALYCDPTDVAIRPLEYTQQLVDILGSVLIFQAGDMCPNFRFMFLKKYPRAKGVVQFDPVSGLLPIPQTAVKRRKLCAEMHRADVIKTRMGAAAKDVIPDMFRYSISPTKEEVEAMIEAFEEGTDSDSDSDSEDENEGSEEVTVGDLIEDPEDSPLTPLIRKTLSQILEIQPDGSARRPGIYYNFSCRGGLYTEVYDTVAYGNGSPRVMPDFGNVLPGFSKKTAAKRVEEKKPVSKVTQAARAILLQGIGEAETRRKHLLRGTRFNRPEPAAATQTRKSPRKRSGSRSRSRSR